MKTKKETYEKHKLSISAHLMNNLWDGTRSHCYDILLKYAGGLGLFIMYDEYAKHPDNYLNK